MEEIFCMEWNMEEIFRYGMEDGMEKNCRYGIWKNCLPFHALPGGGRHNALLNALLTALHLFCDMIIIGKESSRPIAFSAF